MIQKIGKKPWSIFIALGLAIIVGVLFDKNTQIFGLSLYSFLELFGNLFLNALTLVIVPLVSSSIITGVARIATESHFGRLGARTFFWFLFTNFSAILIGFSLSSLFQPGKGIKIESNLPQDSLNTLKEGKPIEFILDIIPSNILEAFAKGNMLGLIFFSLLFGYAITKISEKYFTIQAQIWKGVFETMLSITHMIMKILPLGVFCLVAKILLSSGFEALRPLTHFTGTVLISLLVFSLGFIPLLLTIFARISYRNYIKALWPAILTAFSTASSSVTLPITLECMEKRGGVSNRICSLVLPLGTSLNLSGTALYNTITVVFISQVYGISLSGLQQMGLILVTGIVSLGIASIPGGGLVAALTILRTIGLPTEGLALVLAVDRILDMFRTTTSLFSYTACTSLVAKQEGEHEIFKKSFSPKQHRE